VADPEPTTSKEPVRRRALTAALGALVGALVVGLLFGGYIVGHRGSGGPETQRASSGGLDIRKILKTAQPSVVSIKTGSAQSVSGSAGSGVVISKDGLILTNNHVIEDAAEIQVQFDDGERTSAELVGSSPEDDIALIRANRNDTVPAKLGSSARLRVGDDVVAIGNALNLGSTPSVTRGIVSAKERAISTPTESLDHLIQTDAAINPGNSGGPLVNARGEVVGVNTAIIRDAQNVGFSIAIDSVKSLIGDLKKGKGKGAGTASKGAFLGVVTIDVDSADLDQSVKDRFGVTADHGAFVTDVSPKSAAESAGIEQGDVLVEIDGRDVGGNQDVTDIIRSHQPGDRITITVERQGRRQSFDVTLRKRGG